MQITEIYLPTYVGTQVGHRYSCLALPGSGNSKERRANGASSRTFLQRTWQKWFEPGTGDRNSSAARPGSGATRVLEGFRWFPQPSLMLTRRDLGSPMTPYLILPVRPKRSLAMFLTRADQKQLEKGLPSNIIAETPSNYASVESPGVSSATQARRSDQFNALTERVFGNVHNDIDDSHGISRYLSRRGSTVSVHSRFALALEDAFNGHYHSAAEKYRLTLQTTCIRWNSMLAQFRLHVMDAACYPGCPQSLAARIADIFSQSLVQAREEYSRPDSEMGSEVELHTALLALRNEAEFWTSVLVQQRAIQLWEPILGSDHPQVAQLRHNIAYKRSEEAICVDELGRLAEGAEVGTLIAPLETDQLPSLQTVRHLLHLGDAPKDQLLEQLRLMESSSVSGQQFRENAGQTRLGRSRALFGVYYSFVGRFSDAETAFGDSERLMGHETCAETKLHRTLWYAEHKTRVQDWNGASDLICRAHQVFMASETASAFIIHHFPGRFESLCTAVSMRTPIDKISSTAGIDDTCPDSRQVASNHPHSPTLGTEVAVRSSSSPAAAVSVLSPDRLFPSTPRGAHASISIEAWRQFVEFNPTGEPTPSAEIT